MPVLVDDAGAGKAVIPTAPLRPEDDAEKAEAEGEDREAQPDQTPEAAPERQALEAERYVEEPHPRRLPAERPEGEEVARAEGEPGRRADRDRDARATAAVAEGVGNQRHQGEEGGEGK